MTETRTDRIIMKVQPSIKERAKKAAAEEGRTLSNWIEKLMIEDIKKKGL